MATWTAYFENSEIKLVRSMKGVELLVNGELQDFVPYYSSYYVSVTGHVITIKGDKLAIKVRVVGNFKSTFRLFVDNKEIPLKKK